jgi:hypothetical protein
VDGKKYHPAVQQVLRHFEFGHLPPHLQAVSEPFRDLAYRMADSLEGPELVVGLRKMLEGKDCCVRAALDEKEEAEQEAERLYQGGAAELEKLTIDARDEVQQLIQRLQNVLTKL